MVTVNLDGKQYEIDDSSKEMKGLIARLHFINSELTRLHASIDAFQTAQKVYTQALKQNIPNFDGDTIKTN